MNTMTPRTLTVFPPPGLPANPGHDLPQATAPPVLDLCVRKNPSSPNYPYDYVSSKCSSIDVDPPPGYSSKPQDISAEASEPLGSEIQDITPNCVTRKLPISRPFRAYTRNPLYAALVGTTDALGDNSVKAYAEFRQKILSVVQPTQVVTNKNMRRTHHSEKSHTIDPEYSVKRRKNNEAAKKSRDARRAKEDEIAIRCAFLENENIQLRLQLATLENKKKRLQSMGYH